MEGLEKNLMTGKDIGRSKDPNHLGSSKRGTSGFSFRHPFAVDRKGFERMHFPTITVLSIVVVPV